MLPVDVAQSFDSVVICTSLFVNNFQKIGSMVHQYISNWRESNSRNYCLNSNQILLNDKDHHWGQSLLSMIVLFLVTNLYSIGMMQPPPSICPPVATLTF